MKRQSIMDTYRELQSVKTSFDRVVASSPVAPDPMVMDYTQRNGRREGLLYNNRIFCGYIRPSQQRKDEYTVNRQWILDNFKK